MISYVSGNLLDADTDAIVNPCNTVGVMGAGLAKQIKDRFPECVSLYESACKAGKLTVGTVLITPTSMVTSPYWVVHLPTKQHWRNDSKIEFVESGLKALVAELTNRIEIATVAIPALGCGLGGLPWSQVKSVMELQLSLLDEVEFLVYLPR